MQLIPTTPTARTKLRAQSAQPIEVINVPTAQLRLPTVLALTGLSRSAFYRLIQAGAAPAPMRFGSRCSRWTSISISQFLAARAVQGEQK